MGRLRGNKIVKRHAERRAVSLSIKSFFRLYSVSRGSAHEIDFAKQNHKNREHVSRFLYFEREKVSAWELSDVRVLRSQNTDCRKNVSFSTGSSTPLACFSFSCRIPTKSEQAGQACRSRPRKIPYKSQGVYLTFIPLPRDTYPRAPSLAPSGQFTLCPEPPLPCRGEGGIPFGFAGTEGVSRGDAVPPGRASAVNHR